MLIGIHRRPKVEAQVADVYKKSGVTHRKNKEYTFAKINYFYESIAYTEEEIAPKTKVQAGDKIICTVDPKHPKDVEEFNPKKDYLPVIILVIVGAALVAVSFWAIDQLQ